jgi:hydrogenase expression/formation protein HypC
MCLGIPGRITEVWRDGAAPMAQADFAGQVRRVCLAYLPDLKVGDYVITHMGYALTLIDAREAATTLAVMREYGVLDPAEP